MTPDDHNVEPLMQSRSMLRGIAQARSEHLTYEQLEAWVEDEMDQTGREWVMAHIGLCDFCAKQLAAYESYAPVMSAPIARPAKLMPFRDRFRAAMGWPQLAMIGLAIAVVMLAPRVIRNSRMSGLGGESLASLPPALRQSAQEVLNANTPLRPAVLADLTPNVDPKIEYPASEEVEEAQPDLRWRPFAASYEVAIFDSSGHEAAQASGLKNPEWIVSVPLNRGAMYTWEVRAMNSDGTQQADAVHQADGLHPADVHRATFRVLGASEEQTLAQLRASGAGPLAMGAIEEQFGLLSEAQREFEKLSHELPRSQDAGKLLDHINSLRGASK